MFRNALNHMLDIRDLKRAEREENEGGFTLIELLVVVVIIGILIAIAIPLYLNYTNGAKDKGAESDVRAAVSAVQQCYTDGNNQFPASGSQTPATTGGTTGGTFTFTMPAGSTPLTCATTATVSDSTTLTYALSGTTYTITGHTDGSANDYKFDSSVGKVTKIAHPTTP